MMKYFTYISLVFWSSVVIAQKIHIQENEATVDFVFVSEDVNGSLEDFKFTGHIDLSHPETVVFSGSVATATLDTNNWLRSRHLRGKKYFDAKNHPRLYFLSTKVMVVDDVLLVSGDLSIKGNMQQVTFRFSRKQNTLTGTTTINTQDYGISIYDERTRNKVIITISLPFNH